jgi:hypothetical protein
MANLTITNSRPIGPGTYASSREKCIERSEHSSMTPEHSSGRPYKDYSELDLYESLHELQQYYVQADRERDEVIQAYSGSGAVLEDEDYRSATQRRSQISDAIAQINDEREFRRQENRQRRLDTLANRSSSDALYTT